jgi:hypothetical protein
MILPGSPFFVPLTGSALPEARSREGRVPSNWCEASTARQAHAFMHERGLKNPFHNKLADLGMQFVDISGTDPFRR